MHDRHQFKVCCCFFMILNPQINSTTIWRIMSELVQVRHSSASKFFSLLLSWLLSWLNKDSSGEMKRTSVIFGSLCLHLPVGDQVGAESSRPSQVTSSEGPGDSTAHSESYFTQKNNNQSCDHRTPDLVSKHSLTDGAWKLIQRNSWLQIWRNESAFTKPRVSVRLKCCLCQSMAVTGMWK